MSLPLTGFRILTLAHLYPGPFATMLLADLGADVVIVEGPGSPDRTRRFPGHFEALNRNKRAVAIDLKDPVGREAFLRLVETADVVLEGFRPGVMARLGLAAEQLKERNPRLICVSLSGYGQTGPMASHGAHDISLQGAAGMLDIPVGEEAQRGLPPFVMADLAAANAAALAITTALVQRERTGHAAEVDVSMLDSIVAWMTPALVPAWNDMKPARLPPTDPGYGVFATRDGQQLTLSISGEDHLWRALCDVVGLPQHRDLSEEERIRDRSRVQAELREAMAVHDADWLEQHLEEQKLPFGPVRSLMAVAQDPQVVARKLVVDFRKNDGSVLRYVRQPLVFDGQYTSVERMAPRLGEHNDELLGNRSWNN
ncbi:formyl-CoA transferase [Polaromonas sp. OV174]|uniref:CaiB/BaiF CoA transferase family protein n=1 Tax=Polaromonas sp. OV174 TaxID=1855300 RepID=UPI0008F348E5|nr:CoA transferase [Polaromonas sp. OV174]SFB89337.1 formyl-CoA transferase [Polaromonas sp. OV174]